MASRMRVTSLMDEARCYEALPITAKTIGHRTQDGQDGTLDCRISEGLSMCEGQVRARSNPNSYLARARTREPRHRDESGWVRKNALQRLRLLRKFVEQLLPKRIIWLKPKAGFGDMANHDLTALKGDV